jgi:peptide/nickel transport system permease protein
MATTAGVVANVAVDPGNERREDEPGAVRRALTAFRRFLSIREGLLGVIGATLMIGIAVFGPLFAPHNPDAILVGPLAGGPTSTDPLGTDIFGRDVLSRFLNGGLSVVVFPLVAVSVALVIGSFVGLVAGYLGGFVDAAVARFIDVILSIPTFLLLIAIIAGFGTGNQVLIIAVAFIYFPSIARVIRASTQTVAPREFVLAARARGDSRSWIIFREIAPNVGPTLLVEIALRLTFGILLIASLTFLGLGVQPPTPNWAADVEANQDLLSRQPLAVLVPAAGIAVLAISINLIADALTKYFGGNVGSEAV